MKLRIYTDGSCNFKDGKGGYAAIFVDEKNRIIDQIAGSSIQTTSNRMEMQALISGFQHAQRTFNFTQVTFYSDSNYVVRGCNDWMSRWLLNSWRNSAGKPVKNLDLWVRMQEIVNSERCSFRWVKGHSSDIFNAKADELASYAIHHPSEEELVRSID